MNSQTINLKQIAVLYKGPFSSFDFVSLYHNYQGIAGMYILL